MNRGVLALILAAAVSAYGAGREFDRVVSAIEKHYGVKRMHIPLMGVANLFVKVTHPAGTSGVKIAVFEDLPSPSGFDDQVELDRFMKEVSGGRLHMLVATRSRRGGEASYILAGEAGKNTELLIATFESHEATVIEATVNAETLVKMLNSPNDAHRMFQQAHDNGDGGGR
jgi:hypothetical protein